MKIGIYGSGGLGREILNLVKQINANSSRWDEYIFIDDTKCDKECKGCKLLPLSSLASQYTPDQIEIVIAVGELDTCHLAIHKLNVRPGGRIHFAKAEVALGEGAMIKIDFVEVYFRKGAV